MRKLFILLFFFILFISVPSLADEWDNYFNIDRAWDGQKSITNKEFEEALNTLEQKKNKKEEKKKQKLIKKIGGGGTSLHNNLTPQSDIQNITPLKKNSDGVVLNVPVTLIIDNIPMEKGFYRVIAEKDKDNNIYLLFYQAHFLKGKVRAYETNEDYDEEKIDFVNLIPHNENYVKVIFGSLDFNAYAFIKYIQ